MTYCSIDSGLRKTVERKWRLYNYRIKQPRPQGLPRGGARAEEDPGKIR